MHLKKRLFSVAAVVAMAAAMLFGGIFGSDTEETDNPLTWLGSQKETIYFWYSDETMTNYLNSAAVAFGEQEGVRVIPVLTSDSEYLEAVNQASISSTQVPDAYIISHESLEKAYLAGLATQIQDIYGVCNDKNFSRSALSAVTYQGKTVAYPMCFETMALVYNATYLKEWARQAAVALVNGGVEEEEDGAREKKIPEAVLAIPADEEHLPDIIEAYYASAAPETLNDLLSIGDSFELPEGVEGIIKWDVSDIFYNYWFVGNYMVVGGDAGDRLQRININNPETIQCLEAYKSLNQNFYIESDTVTYESVVQDFCDGKIVFTIATTDIVERLAAAEEEGSLAFEYGIARLPQVSEALDSRAMSVTNVVAVNGYSQHTELANRFAAYLVGECADSLYGRTGKVSANIHAETDNKELQVFKAEYADSVPLPKMMETGNFWLQLEGLFSKVWNGADVTELVQELADQIAVQVNAATR